MNCIVKQGLYCKFTVERVDGSSREGAKHEDCEYFVLDIDHDRFSAPALEAYATACADEFPLLATDVRAQAQRNRWLFADDVRGPRLKCWYCDKPFRDPDFVRATIESDHEVKVHVHCARTLERHGVISGSTTVLAADASGGKGEA